MKKIICSLLLLMFCFTFIHQSFLKADWDFNPRLKFKSEKNTAQEKINRDYLKALKLYKRAAALFGASIDFQIGYNSTNANVDTKPSTGEISSTSKGGFNLGAMLNLNILNILNFSTGLDFTKKNFGLSYSTPTISGDSVTTHLSYLNIPMNISLGGMISPSVGFYFSGGPYFGILLTSENALTGFKDFDLGLNGVLTTKYFLNPFMAILLGTRVQYGGLNNLLTSNNIDKVTTLNWGVFTGLGFGFGL